MESKSYLESLRDISDTQLEALLRFDSPPETPIKPPDKEIVNNSVNEKESINIKSVDISLLDNIYSHNNGQHLTQMNSQIDFSIFHNVSPNDSLSLSISNELSNNYVDSVMETIEIFDTSVCEEKKNCNKHDSILEFCSNSNNNSDTLKFSNMSQVENYEDDFEQINNIYKKLDFTKIQKSLFDKHKDKVDQVANKLCHTQIDVEASSSNPNKKVISSCPPFQGNKISDSTEILQDQFLQNVSADIIHSSILSDTETTKNEMEEIFKNLDFDHISDYSDYNQKQCQNQFHSNVQHLDSSNSNVQHLDNNDNHTTCNLNHYTKIKTPYGYTIPFSVRQLYDIVKTKYSDFAFIYALSSQLCQDRVPMECFVTLKMGLLLSLVSIGNNINRPPIPIVAITSDTYMTDYLMRNIGQLGLRFLGSLDDVKSISLNNWIQADPFLMARGGVYYVGDWTRLKLKRTETIFKNIECSTVALEKTTQNFPLEAAIWTHWRSFKYGVKDQQMFNKFLKIFGIPIFVSDDNHEVLVDYTLEQTSVRIFESTVDHLSISEDDMRNFLINVSQSTMDLSAEAELLLKNYFVVSRSNRTDCLSKQSYITLKQFAESFAKLSMHNEVLSDDAIAAIIICEHFIGNTFNSCDDSPPHFGNFNFVGAVDEYFINFKKWLNTYLEKYINK